MSKTRAVLVKVFEHHMQSLIGCGRHLLRLTVPRCRAGKPSAECTVSIRLAKACVVFPFVTLPSNCTPGKQLMSSQAKVDGLPDGGKCSACWAGFIE